ncbi:helix-turn-helix domain-containing protein [Streptomyces sp. NPDC096191]|uniref:TetR/AcrR family transcriptional regulator n=1 Tax=Streptomyces sp. NPDC096191 TaxID=3155426 RepID=UPI00332700F5
MPTALAQLGRTSAPAPLADAVALSGFLDLLPDPRGVRGRRYRLSALVAAAAASVLAGARSLTAITEWISDANNSPKGAPHVRRFPAAGRRERNKQLKLDRITAAAHELFAERGINEVTTQQIADKADIGTGTLFLYAKTKGELLLLVQNSLYAEALERGRADAEDIPDTLDAVMTIVRPVVECNRTQVDNGRVHLREMIFGDPAEPHHHEALTITGRNEQAVAAVLCRDAQVSEADAATTARVVSAVTFLAMAASVNVAASVDEILRDIREQIAVLLRR